MDDIAWNINQPLPEAKFYDEKTKTFTELPKSWLDKRVQGARPGLKVAILPRTFEKEDEKYFWLEPVRGPPTYKNLLNALYRGMHKPLPLQKVKGAYMVPHWVYAQIGWHFQNRVALAEKYERGELTAAELASDHVYFEGGQIKDGIFWPSFGS